jgi:Leucine Rich repeat
MGRAITIPGEMEVGEASQIGLTSAGWFPLNEDTMKPSGISAWVVAALALLTSGQAARGDNERDQALAEIKKLGGTVVNFPFSVSFDGKGVGDDALELLRKLPDLEAIYLRRCKVTDQGLEKLARLTRVKYLFLDETAVSDRGLAYLKGMSRLQKLGLMGTCVTDEGLAHLKDLNGLRVLEIKGSKVTDAGMIELRKTLPRIISR